MEDGESVGYRKCEIVVKNVLCMGLGWRLFPKIGKAGKGLAWVATVQHFVTKSPPPGSDRSWLRFSPRALTDENPFIPHRTRQDVDQGCSLCL
jgi:hypothetical protein